MKIRLLLALTLYLLSFEVYGARLFAFDEIDEERDITVNSIKWIKGEPKELLKQTSYIKFKKNYYIKFFNHVTKRMDEETYNMHYGYIDITNDKRKEIFVRETSPASAGYVIAIFENQDGNWKSIFDGRGGFIFEPNENRPHKLIYYERSGSNHVRYELKYINQDYALQSTLKLIDNDLTYHESFWQLNESLKERCERASAYPSDIEQNYLRTKCDAVNNGKKRLKN